MNNGYKVDTSTWSKCGCLPWASSAKRGSDKCDFLTYDPLLGGCVCKKYNCFLLSANGYNDIKRCAQCVEEQNP